MSAQIMIVLAGVTATCGILLDYFPLSDRAKKVIRWTALVATAMLLSIGWFAVGEDEKKAEKAEAALNTKLSSLQSTLDGRNQQLDDLQKAIEPIAVEARKRYPDAKSQEEALSRLRLDIDSIAEKLAPRRLTVADQERFGSALARVPKLRVTIVVNADPTSSERDEQYNFAGDIERALKGAGWTATLVRIEFPRRPQPLTGLGVWGATAEDESLRGVGGAFDAIGLRPVIGTFEAAAFTGAPVSTEENGPHIQVSVFGRPAP